MIKSIIRDVEKFLPLNVEAVDWSDPVLTLTGPRWSFSTMSSWRLVENRVQICGCDDEFAQEMISDLEGVNIIAIEIQSMILLVDPVFVFSNSKKLEIFSSSYLEPWIFNFSSGITYVASPSDPN